MLTTIIIIIVIILAVYLFLQHPQFGKAPSGARLEALKKSPNYKNGKFENFNLTPQLTEGYTLTQVLKEFLFKKVERKSPVDTIPSVKTDLKNLPANEDILVWFGHSSYFIQIDGKRFLIDPVFSGSVSPIPGTSKAFKGADIYSVDDMPEIDFLIITHDHYDHIDYKTIVRLKPKVNKVICGLGVGSHFEHWGYPNEKLIEKDWYETINIDNGFTIHTTPARHFSGRKFARCNTLWQSYVMKTPTMTIFIGGDSGYDTHYKAISNQFGPFDLALLDNGQYDIKWKYIHHHPPEVLQAAKDLKTKRLLPVHSSKFVLANHPWDEPLKRVSELNSDFNIPLVTPMIGEVVNLKDENQQFKQWWVGIE